MIDSKVHSISSGLTKPHEHAIKVHATSTSYKGCSTSAWTSVFRVLPVNADHAELIE